MAEFYMDYFEINHSKNQLIHTGENIDKLDRQFRSISSILQGERGLGIEEIVDRIDKLEKKNKKAAGALVEMGNFLKEVINQTEEANQKAKKILEDFSVREKEKGFGTLKTFAKNLISVITSGVGVMVSDNPRAKWFNTIIGALGSGLDAESLGAAAREMIKTVGKSQLGQFLKNVCGACTVAAKSIAGWAVDFIEDIIENFTDGQGSFGDDLMESGAEGAAGGALYFAAGGVAALLIGALGITTGGVAAAVVTTAVTIVVKWAADSASEAVFHNEEGFVENAGDVVCNWAEQMFG